MKLTFNLLLICLLILFSAKSQEPHLLKWSKSKKLSWEDFRKIDKNDEPPIGIVGAMTNVVFDYKNLQNGTVSLPIAMFDKLSSWTIISDSLFLAHEQLHFDLGELYARKIRKEFVQLYQKKEANRQKYLNIIQKHFNELRKVNNDFDKESYEFSPLRNKLDEWNERDEFSEVLLVWQNRIACELNKLEDYRIE